jgi:ATP-dependent RNA helicase RhlE
MTFDSLGLEPKLLQGVAALGYDAPTPIQEQAIPRVLGGADVVGCAQTGTGKTAAFVLPTLQRIPADRVVRALVVTPTRELAVQVGEVAEGAARATGHHVAVIHGGVGYEPQFKRLRKGVELVVATPGRLLDVHQRKVIDLSKVEVLVLDEADRMLDMGFWPDVRRIIGLLPEKRQTLLFSATMSKDVLRVVRSALREPVQVEASPSATPVEAVEQAIYPVNEMQKNALLAELLVQKDFDRVLVFTRTKERADRVARVLEKKGVSCTAIHGDRKQAHRQRALDRFKDGGTRVLVATDVMARGIDVEEISHVINYDMPNGPDDYVHRIGRTARAGATGDAISFLTARDTDALRDIERTLGYVIPARDLDGFEYQKRVVPDPDRDARSKPRPVYSSGVMGRGRGRGRIMRR